MLVDIYDSQVFEADVDVLLGTDHGPRRRGWRGGGGRRLGFSELDEYPGSPDAVGLLLAQADDVTDGGREGGTQVENGVTGRGVDPAQQHQDLQKRVKCGHRKGNLQKKKQNKLETRQNR